MSDPAQSQRLRHYGRRLGRKLRPARVALLETLLPQIRIPSVPAVDVKMRPMRIRTPRINISRPVRGPI